MNDMNKFIRIEDITEEQLTKDFTNLWGVEEDYRESNAANNNANRTEITQKEINTRIKSLINRKAPGPHEILMSS